MLSLDWNYNWIDLCIKKETLSYLDELSSSGEQDTANTSQPVSVEKPEIKVKEEKPEEGFNNYDPNNCFGNSATFDDWMKPESKFSNSPSFDYLKRQYSPNDSILSENLKQPISNNVNSFNKCSNRQSRDSISITKNNSSSFSDLKYQARSNNSNTLYDSTSFNYLKDKSNPNNSSLSNDFKHQSIYSKGTLAKNWSKHQTISPISITKNNCASFKNLKRETSSDDSILYKDLTPQTFSPKITLSSDRLKLQFSSNNFSSQDCQKFNPRLNKSFLPNDCVKIEPSTNVGWSKNWLSSGPVTDTYSEKNDWMKPPPNLNNSAPTNNCVKTETLPNVDWPKNSLSSDPGADTSSARNDWIKPPPNLNNSAPNNDCVKIEPPTNFIWPKNSLSSSPGADTSSARNHWMEPPPNLNNSAPTNDCVKIEPPTNFGWPKNSLLSGPVADTSSARNDWMKPPPNLNNSTSTNDCVKIEPPSNDGWSKNLLSSDPGADTSSARNDWLKPPPNLNNSASTNDLTKYMCDSDWLEPQPTSNNSPVNNNCLTLHPTTNDFSANSDSLKPISNTFVSNIAWLEPETNSNNSVIWLMPQPNSPGEINMPPQQLTNIKQEIDTKPVLTELQAANYDTHENIFFQDDIKFIPSPDTEYIFKSSPEELFKICGLDDLIQTPTEELLKTSDVDDIISNLNMIDNVYEMPRSQIINEDPLTERIQRNPVVNPIINKEPIIEMQPFKKNLNRKYFKCPQCVYNTNTREHLEEHINKIHCHSNIYHHNMLSSNRSKSRNGKTKTDNNVLQEFQVAPKSSVYLYKCSNCKYKTRRVDRYQKHMEEKTCGELPGMDNTSLRTPNTSGTKTGKENRHLKRSSTYNSRPKANRCLQCSYSTHRSDCLQKHIEKVHSKSICYKCNSCSYQSTYTKEYYEHMRRHYAGPPFVCDVCSYKSKLITAFVAHRVIHTGDRLFCCTMCAFSCKRKYHLKGHMISHSREKNFTCKFCFKKYSYKCSLVRHLKTACRSYVPES